MAARRNVTYLCVHVATTLLTLALVASIPGAGAGTAEASELPRTARVAIVGAGAAGSSTARFLSHAARDRGARVDLHVFEATSRVGGRVRSHVVEHGAHVEAGASIMVDANKYVLQMVHELPNVTLSRPPADTLGIYAGGSVPLMLTGVGSFDSAALALRYGLRPLQRMRAAVSSALERWLRIYELQSRGEAFSTAEELLDAVNLLGETKVSLAAALESAGMKSPLLMTELVACCTRVNYNQLPEHINALAGLVSMVPMVGSKVWNVAEGNAALFAAAIEEARADLHLRAAVEGLSVQDGDDGARWSLKLASGDGAAQKAATTPFDAVVLTTPRALADQDLVSTIGELTDAGFPPERVEFRQCHATFVNGTPRADYFGWQPRWYATDLPRKIMSDARAPPNMSSFSEYAYAPASSNSSDGAESRIQAPARVHKIFSERELSDAQLDGLFESWQRPAARYPWRAYPWLRPPARFPPFVLSERGLYYTPALEHGLSAMEVAAVAAKNVALLVMKGLAVGTPAGSDACAA
mmetsp:Transcript_10240/g.42473  ORF Transcript_10240/g.42473 Transcript_10240/m.42473 type:complete len:527 (-) Transcript_10240:5537-7117(-)|eukprot:PRCOL_00003919-RA